MRERESRPGEYSEAATPAELSVHAKANYGAPCPDCAAPVCPSHGGHHHEATCPLGRALAKVERKDRRWFADNPRAKMSRRRTSPAEATTVELQAGFRPTHAYVIAKRGWLSYGYGDASRVRVIHLVGGGGDD